MSPEEGTTIHRSTIELLDKLNKYLKQRDDYKAQRDTLIYDITVLRANNERLERENHDLKKRNALLMNTVDDSDKENKHLKEYMKEETFYYQWQNCIDENEKLERENDQLKQQLKGTREFFVDVTKRSEKQLDLLQDFSKFINYKLVVCPANDSYKHYRSELNKLGVK